MTITNDEHIMHAVEAGAAIARTCGDTGYIVTAMRRILGVELSNTLSFRVDRPMVIGLLGHVSATPTKPGSHATIATFETLQ